MFSKMLQKNSHLLVNPLLRVDNTIKILLTINNAHNIKIKGCTTNAHGQQA